MTQQDQGIVKLVTARQTKLESDRTNFDQRMQDVADYVSPHRDDILGTLVKGQRKGDKIFDGTAVSAAVLAADGIHGYHMSPAFPWFKYEMNRKEVNRIPEVMDWLQEIEFNMYMALNRSNFYSEGWSWIYDGLTLGTAPIFPEEDLSEGRIVFEAVHPGECYVAENRYGEVDVLHRKRKMTARKIIQQFGAEHCPEIIHQAYENSPFEEYEVIHAVFPREEYDSRMKDAKNKKYASCWILTAGNHLLRVSGFDQFPYNVWRYMKTGKSPYGVSPAHLSISDIKGLNLMGKTMLGAAQLAVDPAYNVPEYLEGKVQLKPRGFNYLKQGDQITPVHNGGSFPIGIDREQAKQQFIRERFHVDTFLMLTTLAGRGDRTAYEVSEMVAEKAAVLGAELGPLNSELDKLLDQVYNIEVGAGRMPQPPDILLEMASEDPYLRFDPVYMGPLAQSQRERFNKEGLRKFFAEVGALLEIAPEVRDNFNFDAAGRILAETTSVPSEVIRPEEEVQATRQQRAQAMQQEAAKEDMERLAGGLKDVSALDKDGSIAKSVMEANVGPA